MTPDADEVVVETAVRPLLRLKIILDPQRPQAIVPFR